MNISYTGRGFEISDAIKKYTQEKLNKLLTLQELLDVSLTLELARYQYRAELLVHNRNARFTAIARTPDVFKSINAVIDKIQKQVKRHKEKLVGRKRKAVPRVRRLDIVMLAEKAASPRVIRARRQDIKPMSQEEALLQLEKGKESFLIFRNIESDNVSVLFRRKDGNYGLIDSEI
jgi:ribosome hibernation promoting factor